MKKLLLNPFERFAGTEALLAGLAVMLLTALPAVYGGIHLDGVIDLHAGAAVTWKQALAEALTDWLVMVAVIYLSGRTVSRSAIRLIDVLGTQALARFPFLPAVGISVLLFNDRILAYVKHTVSQQGDAVEISAAEWIAFVCMALVIILCLVWTIVLMYRAYSVACNAKGTKGVVSFIVSLLLAEVISKLLLLFIM